MELKNNNRINFIIDTLCTIDDLEHKGSSICIHKLAFELAKMGNNVYIFNDPIYPHDNINIIKSSKTDNKYHWESFSFPTEKTVCVYTQATIGNPFSTIHNCRWYLHDSDNIENTHGENDIYYNFNNFIIDKDINQNRLTTFDYKMDKFYNLNNEREIEYCMYSNKDSSEIHYDYDYDISIWYEKGFDYLFDILNKCQFMITNDDMSFMTTISAMCGCIPIIINPKMDPVEYRLKNPIQMFGVSYGWDDIDWAKKTINLVKHNLLDLEEYDINTVKRFYSFWKKRLNYDSFSTSLDW